MRESAYAIAMGVAVFGGCDRKAPQGPDDPARNPASSTPADSRPAAPASPAGGPATVLPIRPEPSAADHDRAIEKSIRTALAGANLSANAKDCEITVESGRVTLRGTTDSQEEKNTVERIARTTAGVKSVTNELKVNQ